MKKAVILSFLYLYFTGVSFAGWKVTLSSTSEDYEYEVTIQAQDNNIRWITPQMELIYNDKSKELIFLNNDKKMYWNGTREKYKDDMETYVNKMMIEAMGEEAYENYKKTMEGMNEPATEDEDAGEIEIIPENETIILAGYTGKKFRIMVDGQLDHEVWLCSEIDLYKDFDISGIDDFFGNEEDSDSFVDSDEYGDLIREYGFPIKEISYIWGEPMDETVLVKAEELSLPNSVFTVPPGYKKADFGELFGQDMY